MAYPLINARFILLTSASFIAIFSSIAIYFCLPILISHMIRAQITLSPTSGSFNNWRLNSVIDRMYLYNITNLSDLPSESSISSGELKTRPRQIPKLKQLGPFTFRQDREKLNIKFDTTNETVIYDQKRTWTFVPELSQMKSLEEMRTAWVNHVSVPLAGTTMNPEYGEFIDPIVTENGLRLFLNHSVETLLFEGYWDLLMEQAKASGQVDVDKFGWMYNQNNTIQRAIRVFTGPSNSTLNKFGGVDEFAYKRELSVWRNNNSEPSNFKDSKCNQFRLSSAGEFFPPPEYSIIGHNNYYQYTQHQQQLNQQEQQQGSDGVNQDEDLSNKQLTAVDQTMRNHLSLVESADLATSESNQGVGGSGELVTPSPRLRLDKTKSGKSISLFMPELCRTIKLFYVGSYDFKDLLLVDRYIANEQTFMYSSNNRAAEIDSRKFSNDSLIESNVCYCNYNENTRQTSCPPNGMMDLFPCRKGSPVGISFPHFLHSTRDKSLEPYLRLFSDDVEANENEHQFFIDLETTLNVPVNVQIVLQFNVRFRQDRVMNWTEEYAYLTEDPAGDSNNRSSSLKDFYLPQMWIKSTASVDDTNLAHLRFIQKHLDLVTPITTIIIFGFASILLMASAKLAYDLTYGPKSTRKSSSCDHEPCTSLNGTHSCSFLDEKKKYYDMQSMVHDKKSFKFASSMGNLTHAVASASASSTTNFDLHRPTTSNNKANGFVISSVVRSDGHHDCESEPLNR